MVVLYSTLTYNESVNVNPELRPFFTVFVSLRVLISTFTFTKDVLGNTLNVMSKYNNTTYGMCYVVKN